MEPMTVINRMRDLVGEHVESIGLFGSAVDCNHYNDIDVAIFVKKINISRVINMLKSEPHIYIEKMYCKYAKLPPVEDGGSNTPEKPIHVIIFPPKMRREENRKGLWEKTLHNMIC